VSRAADPKISGVVFEPFSAVESELATTQKAPSSSSYGRTDFHPECEAAINEQINIEYNVSYVYHAMYTYFARDNVGTR
jgi:ferritin heavy chain